jgi:hypothetical protein
VEKRCSKCSESLPIDKFSPTKRNKDGSIKYRASWCNPCRTSGNRKGKEPKRYAKVNEIDSKKECNHCRKILDFSCFSKSTRGSVGLAAYCKQCQSIRYKNSEKSRDYTRAYRKRHPERWKAMHRVHQFNRRSLIKATDDGTVTDEFLKQIYSTETCFWCKKFVPKELRTLEHIVELSNGGEHSARNITMACLSCNSSRLNKENEHDSNICENRSAQ